MAMPSTVSPLTTSYSTTSKRGRVGRMVCKAASRVMPVRLILTVKGVSVIGSTMGARVAVASGAARAACCMGVEVAFREELPITRATNKTRTSNANPVPTRKAASPSPSRMMRSQMAFQSCGRPVWGTCSASLADEIRDVGLFTVIRFLYYRFNHRGTEVTEKYYSKNRATYLLFPKKEHKPLQISS